MRKLSDAIMLVVFVVWFFPQAAAGSDFPQLLPPASDFELTLREDPNSKLPLGPSCGGEAGLTLSCRAFVVTLKNVGPHTTHLSRIGCQEPVVNFERKLPNSSSGWWPISRVNRPACTLLAYVNIRLKPGESTEYATRLVSLFRPADDFQTVPPGEYTLRARWWLWGCTENPEGSDCLTPLQILKPASWGGTTSGVEIQTPVEVFSNEIKVQSPPLPDLGTMKFGFEVNALPNQQGWSKSNPLPAKCVGEAGMSIECTVFHYAIRNLGDRPVRNGRWTCNDDSIMPEYRLNGGKWKRLKPSLQDCIATVYLETPILPGKAAEGILTIPQMASIGTAPLYPAGEYHFRFRFQSNACIAAPDGSFCLVTPKDQTAVTSNEVTVHATQFVPSGKPE